MQLRLDLRGLPLNSDPADSCLALKPQGIPHLHPDDACRPCAVDVIPYPGNELGGVIGHVTFDVSPYGGGVHVAIGRQKHRGSRLVGMSGAWGEAQGETAQRRKGCSEKHLFGL